MARAVRSHTRVAERWWFCPRCCQLRLLERDFEHTPKFGLCFEHSAPVRLRLVLDEGTLRWLTGAYVGSEGKL